MFDQGWYLNAKHIASKNLNKRPSNTSVSLVVIHCISLPEGQYDNLNVESLFSNTLDCKSHESFESLEGVKVSAHFYIKRCGEIIQFVSVNDRAWHAGRSSFQNKENCNDFSIGIELQGTDKTSYSSEQYVSLKKLLIDLKRTYLELKSVTGHENIAPGRKTDPGICFEWRKIKGLGLKIYE